MRLQQPLATLVALICGAGSLLAQSTRDRAVELNAVAQETPPAVTLQWNSPGYTPLSQKVYRRPRGGSTWVQIAAPANAATSYVDNAVSLGAGYEYYVVRTRDVAPFYASGYVSAGIRLPVVSERGRVILLVDNTMAAPLATELMLFADDLTGDGWTVVRQDVSRTATSASIRATIQAIYNADPANTVAVILFGHIPVPYSGDLNIDGHPDHKGAWPTDVYYGDMDGTWTDTQVNDTSASQARHWNVPGDGKLDQTFIPSDIELEVGRIDLADLPAFGVGETELLRRYLGRDHNYRHKLGAFGSVVQRGLVDDNFGYFGGEAFAVTAWRSFTACAGAGNVQVADWFGTLPTQSYQWAYGCGAGDYVSAAGVGSTSDFAATTSLAVFNVTFGSYFGDWDNSNAFLRAPLAGTASGLGLASCWAGRPHWYFHHMALGETIGYSARATQNNDASTTQGYDGNGLGRLNHLALLGDPTLRLYPLAPPSNLTAVPATQAVTLNWTAPAGGPIAGYLISRASSPAGPFVRINGALVTGTSFVDRTVTPGATCVYLVRAVKLETSPTGTFFNAGQGVFSATATAGAASGPEINLRGNANPIAVSDTAPLAANGTDFGTVEIGAALSRFFTITNAGTSTLNINTISVSNTPTTDFTITSFPPTTIAAGMSATFQVQFHPSATGSRLATVTLTTNDADEATYAFTVGGTGLPAHAEIAIYPPSIQRSIHPGDSIAETITISDPGPGTLTHSISSSQARYAARDSDSFGGPAYNWVDISASGTEITGWANLDDAISGVIPIGFSFPFYGNAFTSLRVCTNGFLSFTDAGASAFNSSLPDFGAPANLIALFWSDLLLLNGTSHVYYGSSGGNFVVQFENAALFTDANARISGEVILKPGGEILLQYKTLTQAGSVETIGIQNAARDNALLLARNVAYAHPGMAIRIRPPGAETWLSLDANSGTVMPGNAQSLSATLNAAGLAVGDYYAELTIASNAPATPAIVLPVRLTVGNTPVESWRLLHFGTTANSGDAADTANPDGDTRNNLLEYALVTAPGTAEPNGPPTISKNGSGYLQMQFSRDATHTDLRYFVEASSDLTGWTTIASGIHGAPLIRSAAHSCVENGAGNVKTVTVEDSAPASTFATRYLRLRVLRD